MIKKEFKINDILNAVNSISKIERKKVGIIMQFTLRSVGPGNKFLGL